MRAASSVFAMRHFWSSRLCSTATGIFLLNLAIWFYYAVHFGAAAKTHAEQVAGNSVSSSITPPPFFPQDGSFIILRQPNLTHTPQTPSRASRRLQKVPADERVPSRRQERHFGGPVAGRRHQRRAYAQERQQGAALRKTAAYAFPASDDYANQHRYRVAQWEADGSSNFRRPTGRASQDPSLTSSYAQVAHLLPVVSASSEASSSPYLRESRASLYPDTAWAASESSYYYLPSQSASAPRYSYNNALPEARPSRPPHRDTLSTTTSTADYGSYFPTRTARKPRANPFAKGDIDPQYRELVREMPLSSFEGTWECLASRSGSADHILLALGINYFKRNLFARHCTQYTVHLAPDGRSFTAHTTLPWNRSISGTVLLGGTEFLNHEPETGDWNVKAYFIDGRVGQIRKNEDGVMYDVRAVLPRDPYGEFPDSRPVMVFQWTYIPNGETQPYTVERWFIKSHS